MIKILLSPEQFHCITEIKDKGMREQMEAMMGGYGIRRIKYTSNKTIYSGVVNSLEWFQSILYMYGFQVEIIYTL